MAGNAAVLGVFFQSRRPRQRAIRLDMTFQATVAVISRALLLGRQLVRVVAGNAPELAVALAFLETPAGVHLLDRADEFVVGPLLGRPHKIRDETTERKAGPVFEIRTAARQDAGRALQVTLLTNRLAQRVREMTRINNLDIDAGRFFAGAALVHVQF